MTITEIYNQYKIMPNLQLHMMRVTAVAWQICDNMNIEVDTDSVVKACLLHDMGNIIKFKLDLYPKFLEPEGLEYWENVKREFIERHGAEEHIATFKIAEELKVSDRVMDIIKSIGFSKSEKNLEHNDFSKKIACYSDHRVTPFGIASLEDRMADGKKRFQNNKDIKTEENQKYLEDFNRYSDAMRKLEEQIFSECKIKPEEINDKSVEGYINKLENYKFNGNN